MSPYQLTMLAAFAAAVATFCSVPAFRLRPSIVHQRGAGPPVSGAVRALRLMAPVQGAPSAFSRFAIAVVVGSVLVRINSETAWVGLGTTLGVGLLVFVGLGRWPGPAVRSRDREVQTQLPSVCTLLAVCLEAGLPLRNAVAAVAEGSGGAMAEAMRRLDTAVRLGVPETEAWLELGRTRPAFADLARELSHAAGSGMALAPVLRHHAREAQRQAQGTAQSRARKAGVSSVVPLMICFLPAFLLIGVVPIIGGVVSRAFG